MVCCLARQKELLDHRFRCSSPHPPSRVSSPKTAALHSSPVCWCSKLHPQKLRRVQVRWLSTKGPDAAGRDLAREVAAAPGRAGGSDLGVALGSECLMRYWAQLPVLALVFGHPVHTQTQTDIQAGFQGWSGGGREVLPRFTTFSHHRLGFPK